MGEWEFYRVPGGLDDPPFLWCWRYRGHDGSLLSTPATFRFFLDCVAHARLHGYSNGPLLTRREAEYGARPPLARGSMQAASQPR